MKPEEILSDLIKIDSANPPGNETAVARYLQELFDGAGIPNDIIEPEVGRGSIIARLGSGPKRLLYLSHCDVVPAGNDWDFDPFSGEIRDGVVHGRGALDCKDLMAAQVCAALRLAREGLPLNGTLIIAALADEEKGGGLGAGFVAEHHLEKIMADFAVNEGAEQPIFVDGKMVHFFQVGEKGTAWSKVTARGVSCHGSVPALGDNAVVKLAGAINALHGYRPEVRLIPEVKTLLAELVRLRGFAVEPDPANVDDLLVRLNLEKSFSETIRAMTRMTISPNMIRGGLKTNIVPDCCEAELDIRILPGQDRQYVAAELRRCIGEEIEIEFTEYREPTFSTADSGFYRLMESVTRELAGSDVLCLPHISTGSTDSKYLRGAGIPAYGIAPMAPGFDPSARTTIHGRNERIDVASLHLKTEFLYQLAKTYLGK